MDHKMPKSSAMKYSRATKLRVEHLIKLYGLRHVSDVILKKDLEEVNQYKIRMLGNIAAAISNVEMCLTTIALDEVEERRMQQFIQFNKAECTRILNKVRAKYPLLHQGNVNWIDDMTTVMAIITNRIPAVKNFKEEDLEVLGLDIEALIKAHNEKLEINENS